MGLATFLYVSLFRIPFRYILYGALLPLALLLSPLSLCLLSLLFLCLFRIRIECPALTQIN